MGKLWTNKEIEFLKNNYGKLKTREISNKLNRSINTIYGKVGELGISHKQNNTKDNTTIDNMIHKYINAPYRIRVLEAYQDSYYYKSGTYNQKYIQEVKELDKYIKLVESIVPTKLLDVRVLDDFRESSYYNKKLEIKEAFKKVLEKLEK